MSRRNTIAKALADKLKIIDGTSGYNTNLNDQVFPTLRFWDEVNNFPSIYMSKGPESREYLPGGFAWGFLPISLKVYTKGVDSEDKLDLLLEDIEKVVDNNLTLLYDSGDGLRTTDISITSIVTDEGLLRPYSIAEVNLLIRYEVVT